MVFPSIPSYYYDLHPSNWQHPQQKNHVTLHHGSSSSNPNPAPVPGGRRGGKNRPAGTMAERALRENAPAPEAGLRCPRPRCGSTNTKFCYYNNYSLSQPRYFCRGCRRYWTRGGSFRPIPVGGGSRRNKRPNPSSSPVSAVPNIINNNNNNNDNNYGSVGAEQWRMIIQPPQFPFPGGFGPAVGGGGGSTSFYYGQVPFEDGGFMLLQGAGELENENEFGGAI